MKVCLIHPSQPNSLDDRLDVPLGLLYMAAVLRNDLLCFLKDRKWSDTVEDYEKLVTWRKIRE